MYIRNIDNYVAKNYFRISQSKICFVWGDPADGIYKENLVTDWCVNNGYDMIIESDDDNHIITITIKPISQDSSNPE